MATQGVEKKEAVVRKIRRFPQKDRRYIIGAAILDLDRDLLKPNGPDRYQILKALAEQAVGQPLTATRSRNNTDIRILIAKEMRTEGFLLEEIAEWMGRDHSTVSYYAASMDDALAYPVPFADLVNKYATFKNLLTEYDKRNL